ncbi:hypothetical protein ACVBEH_16910 [Roseateles sp. GG27B]
MKRQVQTLFIRSQSWLTPPHPNQPPGNSHFIRHTQAEADANAKLVASAPALLAALVYLRDCIESDIEPGMGKVNDAIRQAGGTV